MMTSFGVIFILACDVSPVDTAKTEVNTTATGATTDTALDSCEGVPLVNWQTFGSAFMSHECQPCHGSWAIDRFGAPEDVTFDTLDDVWRRAELVLERATGKKPTMPPNGGTFLEDQTKLDWWLRCAPEGT